MKVNSQPKREWITIPADSVRRLVVFLLIVAAAVGGYQYWQRSHLRQQAEETLRDANALAEEFALSSNAADLLRDTRTAFDRGDWTASLSHGQRFITLVNSLHEPSGGVRVLQAAGNVESRSGDSQSWQRVRSGARLKFGTWVKTDAGGTAELLFPGGAILQMRPAAMMRLEGKADLFLGDVEVATSTREQTVTTLGTATRLGRGSKAKISVDTEGGSTVAVFSGDAEVTTEEGERRRLGPLQQVVKTGARLSEVETVLAGPELAAPDDWQFVDPGKVDEIVLAWQSVDGARAYRLQVASGPLFATTLIDDERSATSARLGASDQGDFHWRVAAVDRKGNPGSWSEVRRFQVRALSAEAGGPLPEPPQLEVDDLLLSGNLVVVTGRTDPQAVVTVQGRRLYVPPSGKFRTTVELKAEGEHTLRIVATNEAGGQAVETRKVDLEAVY